jgi:hypothetical protein
MSTAQPPKSNPVEVQRDNVQVSSRTVSFARQKGQPLGLKLEDQGGSAGALIKAVVPGGAAARAGCVAGETIVAINAQSVVGATYATVLAAVKAAGLTFTMATSGGVAVHVGVAAMQQHPADVNVQACGQDLLAVLPKAPTPSVSRPHTRLLTAMKQHPADARVQESGCDALGNLAFNNPANKQAIGASGGVEVVLAAMQQHLASADVQACACRALANLAADNQANKQTIAANGGVAVVLAAMQQHPSVPWVQAYGKQLLTVLPKAATPSVSRPRTHLLQAGAPPASPSRRP